MTEVRQCWAFHRDGMRCEHPAGHPGDHTVSKTWKDIECATPGEFEPAKPTVITTSRNTTVEVKDVEPDLPTRCAACSHNHKSGPCKCGCYEFIG